ncbi:MAG: electron transporter RnfE [Acidobacteria bacterium CG_4_9_14_3_um_filter_49_7]|nr:MAG: electron transporter RnfE [Acidobacteria bacterium CG_4_9_14_3_um_filter_49_7]
MMGHGFFGGMWLWPLLLIVIVIACVVLLTRGFRHGCCSAGHPTHKNADEILQERHARGDISWEEFERIKEDLDGNRR